MLSPSELLVKGDGVFTTTDGQCAWRKSHLAEVIEGLVKHGYAIMSGEVWVVEGNLFSSLSPRKDGGWAIFSWDVPCRDEGESWEQYTQRTATETLNAVCGLHAEEEVAPEASSNLYYYLCVSNEADYNHMIAASVWQSVPQQLPIAI